MPEEGSYQTFENKDHSMRVPFVVYADFECFTEKLETKPKTDPADDKPHTKAYQKHTQSGFCYYIKCFDDTVYSKAPMLYTMQKPEEDVAQIFVEKLEGDIKAIFNENNLKKVMTEEDKKDYEVATICWLCNDALGDDKVRDYCHFTGKYRGAAHNECNLKYKAPKFIPVFFHNLAGYDSHLFIKNLGSTPGQLTCIPSTEEKYISFS